MAVNFFLLGILSNGHPTARSNHAPPRRRQEHKDGKPGNMYINLADNNHEHAEWHEKFKKWVGHWTLKKRPDWTEADQKTVTVRRLRARPRVLREGMFFTLV
ncbi:MAG: hypothetical protein HY083_00675 [Gammaproteobacteria bacterium]|nr:hypothetical protein [Gammaproteobacteria bacterium]